jgi:elongation factor P hydroxylase
MWRESEEEQVWHESTEEMRDQRNKMGFWGMEDDGRVSKNQGLFENALMKPNGGDAG